MRNFPELYYCNTSEMFRVAPDLVISSSNFEERIAHPKALMQLGQ